MDDPCTSPRVELDDGLKRLVGDVMVKRPKTLPAEATVADLRRLFENPRVRTALLVDSGALVGAIDRESLDPLVDGSERADSHLAANLPTIAPEATVSAAVELLRQAGTRRLVVVDADGVTLRGLVCLDGRAQGFCTDAADLG
ncbi:MAG: CBS domain-containing protein [Actinomycetota bacterium]